MFRRALIVAFIVSAAGCSDSKNSDSGQQEKDASSKPADAATATDSGKTPTSGTGGRTGAGNAGSAAANGGSGGKPDSGVITMDSGSPKPADAGAANDDDASQDPGPAPKTCFGTTKLDAYVSDPKLCVYTFATGLPSARGMAFAPNGDLFLSAAKIVVLWDADKNGASDANERSTFAQGTGLNHGIVFSPDAKFVYASSPTTVYRWTYTSGQRQAQGDAQVVVSGIPDGGHSTRTLQFDSQGRLIVSIGSASNVDTTQAEWDTRAQIRRFTIPATLPNGGLAYTAGEVIASGMRNECGIFVDADDRLWGVENGRDNLSDNDLGGDIHNDNPGEEINLVDGQGSKFYGYPRCFSEFKVNTGGMGAATQWADQSLPQEMQATDAFCQDPNQVHPPAWVMPAHWAPLGVIRYTGRALPMNGDLLIGAHGSWNRDPATGRVLARARLQGTTITALDIIVGEKDNSGQVKQGTWEVRPVDLRQGPDEAVYFSDDQGGRVFKLGYEQ